MAKAKQFHVHCNLPNASNLINGIEFAEHEDGGVRTVSPVDADVAEHFKSIKGYTVLSAKGAAIADPDKAEDKAAERNAPDKADDGQADLLPKD